MAYKYTHFIPQNIAPKGAESIVVYDGNGKEVCTIPLGRMAQPTQKKRYSFGLVSDVHIAAGDGTWNPTTKLDNALTYFENQGCSFCCISGDLTQTGFYRRTSESDASTTYLDESQLSKYKEICDKHSIPVYEIAGNHESYYGMPVSDNLTKWGTYTGKNVLHYTVEQDDDLFIFLGHPSATTPMSDDAFTFLSETLSANSNKRCFVFVHPLWNDDSGDANGIYASHSTGGGTLLSSWSKGTALKDLLKQYPKVVLFHGHTHIKFEEQEKDKSLNYTKKNGFHSVHIPSLGRPRDIVDNKLVYAESESQGYIVDVYDDCIVLNGMAFNYTDTTAVPVPLGTFKIYTT